MEFAAIFALPYAFNVWHRIFRHAVILTSRFVRFTKLSVIINTQGVFVECQMPTWKLYDEVISFFKAIPNTTIGWNWLVYSKQENFKQFLSEAFSCLVNFPSPWILSTFALDKYRYKYRSKSYRDTQILHGSSFNGNSSFFTQLSPYSRSNLSWKISPNARKGSKYYVGKIWNKYD